MFVGPPQIARSTPFLSRTRSRHLVQSSGVKCRAGHGPRDKLSDDISRRLQAGVVKERGAFKLEIVFDPVQVDAGLVCAARCMLTGM